MCHWLTCVVDHLLVSETSNEHVTYFILTQLANTSVNFALVSIPKPFLKALQMLQRHHSWKEKKTLWCTCKILFGHSAILTGHSAR